MAIDDGVADDGHATTPDGRSVFVLAIAGSSLAGLRKISQDSGKSIDEVITILIGLGVQINYREFGITIELSKFSKRTLTKNCSYSKFSINEIAEE